MGHLEHSTAVCCWCGKRLVRANDVWWCRTPACGLRQLKYATYKRDETGKVLRYLYVPSPRQVEWHDAVYDRRLRRILCGGAAGPGKSRMIREALYLLAQQVPGLHALLLRRTHKDLEGSHLRFMAHEVDQLGGSYKSGPPATATFLHPNQPAAIIRCGHMEADADVENYLSSEYDVIAPDELVTYARDPMLELFTRARTTNPHMIALRGNPDEDYDGALVLTASNPGGRGGAWVKAFFIDHAPDPEEFPDYVPGHWAFFPAYLKDNPYVKAGGYMQSLSSLRASRKRQLLDGDWSVYEGQFFEEFRPEVHVRDLGPIDPACTRFLSMDWGYNSPGVVLWWAVLPDGHYYLEDELKFNGGVGKKLVVKDVAAAIRERCTLLGLARVPVCWTDPACWQHTGQLGESIADTFLRRGVPVVAANNDRINGWQRVHEMFRLAPDGRPWLVLSPKCVYAIRTIPTQLQSKTDPDDLETTGDDHAVDALRYGGVSGARPMGTTLFTPPAPYSVAWWHAIGKPADAHLLGAESHA